ncbi:17-beta-hydroxysteroid dehydrogenase 13-like [Protopterus annectens]|uniref:17-beta-hydroxysteroid dehydrogenase 13-like n=1 Tax=Protopterus annectens TaxID=7888 RepID=UPI001CFB882F|nr:17-beta-hydroxysteroid dehydrogenase 13-like [Protopterus annectens]
MNLILECLLLFGTILFSFIESFVKLFLPKTRKPLSGELVLITGAGHGIGKATALQFARHGATLILWDINKEGVQETASECQQLGAKAHAYQVDCIKREDIYKMAEKVQKDIGDVTVLINNAGVVTCTDLLTTTDDQTLQTFSVNILAHFWTTRAFLPAMMKNNHGHIVTVASAAGHFGTPFLVDYSASKFAAVGFHEALTEELNVLGKEGIKTTCLCPFFVNTGFVANISSRLIPVLEVEYVVDKLIDGIQTNKRMIFLPPSVYISVLIKWLFPVRAVKAMSKFHQIKFEDRKKED